MSRARSLAGRPLDHPLIAECEARKMEDARKGADADEYYANRPAYESAGKFIARSKYIPPTLHEQAQSNPLLRALLRELQG